MFWNSHVMFSTSDTICTIMNSKWRDWRPPGGTYYPMILCHWGLYSCHKCHKWRIFLAATPIFNPVWQQCDFKVDIWLFRIVEWKCFSQDLEFALDQLHLRNKEKLHIFCFESSRVEWTFFIEEIITRQCLRFIDYQTNMQKSYFHIVK